MGMSLLVVLAVYLYRSYGGALGTRYTDLNKSEDIYTEPEAQSQDAEATKFHAKIQARLDRFDERLMRAANKLEKAGSETSGASSGNSGTRLPWAAGRE